MIIGALKLMLIGMLFVFLFLILMMLVIQLVSRLFKKHTQQEAQKLLGQRKQLAQTTTPVAAIIGAVRQYQKHQ